MRENTLDTTRTLPQLLRFVAPSIVMMLAMGIYTITDTLFVSRLVNTDALSAINIVCPMINLIIGLSSMLASGGVAVLCRDMGAGLLEKVRKNAALLCVCTIGLGCVLAIGGLLFTDELLQLLHAKGRILPYARGYLSMLLLFTPFCMLQVLYQSMFVAAGRPLLGMLLAMCAGSQCCIGSGLHVRLSYGNRRQCPCNRDWLYGSGYIWNAVFPAEKGKGAAFRTASLGCFHAEGKLS